MRERKAAGVTATLTYDPLGRLWQVVKGAANTRFLYWKSAGEWAMDRSARGADWPRLPTQKQGEEEDRNSVTVTVI